MEALGAMATALGLAVVFVAVQFFKPLYRSIVSPTTFKLHAEYEDETGGTFPFPNVFETLEPQVALSVIVPAFNEQDRMPIMLNEALKFLDKRRRRNTDLTFEVIVVDDGSRDRTKSVAQTYAIANGSNIVRVLSMATNSGKGAAVQAGMLHARGAYMLMVDADGASRFSDLVELETAIKEIEIGGRAVAIGSRAHMQKESAAKRHWIRNALMHGFNLVVVFVAGVKIADTQCGFKLFSRSAARDLFSNLHLMRWAFDVELICIAGQLDIPMIEVPIHWHEVGGSKVSLIQAAITMFRDIVSIRLCYLMNLWTIRSSDEVYAIAARHN